MAQNFTKPDTSVSAARLRQGLGYVPQRPLKAGDGLELDGSTGVIGNTEPSIVTSITFGTGAPGGVPADNDLYFDDTGVPYVGYIGRAGVWQQFS